MTAPTPGKERGAAAATRGPFPPASSALPSLPSRCGSLRAPASGAPRRAQPSPPSPAGSDRSRPSGKLAPSPSRDLFLPARPAPCSPARGRLAAGGCGNPKPRGGGGGMEEDRVFPGATAPSWAAPASGDPSAGLPVCAPSDPGSMRATGHQGWSKALSRVHRAEGGRDPARRGLGVGKTRSG